MAYPPYKFTGKEEDPETGLIYFGARYYDAAVGIWHGVDPLAEKYAGYSPYSYCLNNPIILSDPDGMDPWPSWVVGAIRSELAYNAAKRTISVWLPERIVWGDDCIKTFNRTCKNVLFNPSQKTGSQMVGIDKDGKPGTHLLLKEAGRASNLSIFTFKDANGKKAKDNSTADHLSKSIGGYIKENFDGKGDEVNIYGISVMNGYHSMMVTYNKDKNGNDVFNLFDQGPATSLLDGNSTFSSAEDLDTAINTYVKDRQDKKTKKGHQYPATVEIFKIEADGCID